MNEKVPYPLKKKSKNLTLGGKDGEDNNNKM